IPRTYLAQSNFQLVKQINTICRQNLLEISRFSIDKAGNSLREFIPLYTLKPGQSTEKIWMRALKHHLSTAKKVDYFCHHPQKTIALLTSNSRKFIIKDSPYLEETLHELTGLGFLQSLELRHLHFSRPFGIGQYTQNGEQRYFLTKTFAD